MSWTLPPVQSSPPSGDKRSTEGEQTTRNVRANGAGIGLPGSLSSRADVPAARVYIVQARKSAWPIVSTARVRTQANVRPAGFGVMEKAASVGADAMGSENVTVSGSRGCTRAGRTAVTAGAVESISNGPLSSQNDARVRFVAVTFTTTSVASMAGSVHGIAPAIAVAPGTVSVCVPMDPPDAPPA